MWIRKRKLKELELNLCVNRYTKCKNDLELVYERIAEAVKIRSKFQWYNEGEKSTKFSLISKKAPSIKSVAKKTTSKWKTKFVIKQK